jgi:hypothetical protein
LGRRKDRNIGDAEKGFDVSSALFLVDQVENDLMLFRSSSKEEGGFFERTRFSMKTASLRSSSMSMSFWLPLAG